MAKGPEHYERRVERYGLDPERASLLVRHCVGRVLDVGCATGAYVRHLEAHGHEAVGVDFARALVEAARAVGGTFEVGRAEALPFEDDVFDTVAAVDLLEHLDDDAAGLAEMARVARRRVLFTVPAAAPEDLRRTGLVLQPYEDASHVRYYTADDARALLARVGLAPRVLQGFAPVDVNGYLLRTIRLRSPWLRKVLFKLVQKADVVRDATAYLAVADVTDRGSS